ncbi:galactose-1-phosphate uridylyltransferase [Pseudonocardia pini]|uniref:galactose-1-phosphate uridylyltransferase n=1 Tax=Pseudonocardia pini TaxID=2758030 RepID=UPI0015F0C507|nr:galactose-1-phosphate uridylyltransferase [Pseudonocardia pini]
MTQAATTPALHRTAGRLSDGREIFWYDAEPGRVAGVDERGLPEVHTVSEIRYDELLDEWVAIASHRQTRTFQPSGGADQCPLCPSIPGRQTEVPTPDYETVVFENRFPSFSGGVGRCEVVCFTDDHAGRFGGLPPERVRLVVDALADRTAELGLLPGVEQVFPFENRGAEIGVTLAHPHGQIYGYPFVTPRTRQQLESARRYRARTRGDLYADVLDRERTAGTRVVAESAHWTAFVPVAARWPVEVHLYPHRGAKDLPELTAAERTDLAEIWLDVLARLELFHGRPLPYIAAWHQAPVRQDRDLARLHLELFSILRSPDKIKYLAGSESGMGVFVNDTTPEDVAARLRDLGA